MIRTPSENCNEDMLAIAKREATRFFGDWPIHVIQPDRQQGVIDYPRVRVTAFFTSLPVRNDMHLSSLVVVWFQNVQLPTPNEDAKKALMSIEWDRLALDYET